MQIFSAMLCFRNESMGVSPVVTVYPEEYHLNLLAPELFFF